MSPLILMSECSAGEGTKRDIGLSGRAMDERGRNGMLGKGHRWAEWYSAQWTLLV